MIILFSNLTLVTKPYTIPMQPVEANNFIKTHIGSYRWRNHLAKELYCIFVKGITPCMCDVLPVIPW